ncbi:MAG: hypothetical protein D6708_06695 [Candidatus Dadabacteria bacterium]|nr:MAG: hypothetical protein D6708_06695 [Candidatus Dadabacteria bacterium]
MRARFAAAALAAALGLAGAPHGLAANREPLRAVQVFVAFGQLVSPAEREGYLRERAGAPVEGAGAVEALLPRTYYDTSVPDRNPAVLLLQVSPGRKVACGLPELPDAPGRQALQEGRKVSFRGTLVDAHDWGAWTTLYLADCAVAGLP